MLFTRTLPASKPFYCLVKLTASLIYHLTFFCDCTRPREVAKCPPMIADPSNIRRSLDSSNSFPLSSREMYLAICA